MICKKPQNFGSEGRRLSIRCPALVGCNRPSPLQDSLRGRRQTKANGPKSNATFYSSAILWSALRHRVQFSAPARRVWLSPQSALQQIPAIKYRTHLIPSHWTLVYAPSAGCEQQPMAKQQIAKTQPQKAPYVTPKIRTLKVSLSFASSASTLHDIFGLARPQALEPDKPEIPRSKRTAGNV